jgi:hypothetical protein
MSVTRAQLIGNVSAGASFSGIVTATSFVGNVTGTATGLSGSPNLTVGVITATSYRGDGSQLTGVGIGTTGSVNTIGIITATTLVATVDLDIPSGTTDQRPVTPITGSIRYNTIINSLEFYTGTTWLQAALSSQDAGDRGMFGGGNPVSNVIDYITIATTGNAIDFGDLTVVRIGLAACSSGSRGVFGGGYTPTPYVTIVNTLDYITIATTGNAADFGDLTVARAHPAACSSSTRGVFGGGYIPANTNTIDYITIATTGNATDFGDLTVARQQFAACSSSTRGVFGGGFDTPSGTTNTIDFITIATTGNATDFGDLTVARFWISACSSSTRGVFGGGYISPLGQNVIDYITIASEGNATDFGDLTVARNRPAACSSAHGGLS